MATYYFSSSIGNNTTGNGSFATPWYSIYPNKSSAGAILPGDVLLFKAGDTWTGSGNYQNVNSSGTSGNPIVFDRYGTGNDPIFTTASIITGWTAVGTSTHASGGTIYSKSGMFDGAYVVGVDGTYALGKYTGTNTSIPKGAFVSGSTTYINLSDGSNPSGHTIWMPTGYQFNEARGIVAAGDYSSDVYGSWVNINHVKVMYTNGVGISLANTDSNIYDCTAVGCGRDGIAFQGYTPNGIFPARSRAYRCTVTYSNAAGDGKGQAYTSYHPYSWFIDCSASYNFKEGFDFISTGTPAQGGYAEAHFGGLIRCESHHNGMNPDATFGSSEIYLDGCHDMLVWGCVAHSSGVTKPNGQLGHYQSNIAVDTERSYMGVYNIHIVNNLCYEASAYNLNINNHSSSPSIYGCTIVNNTFIRGVTTSPDDFGSCFNIGTLTSTIKTIIKNNNFVRTTGNYHVLNEASSLTSANVDMDYNCYYDPNKSAIISTGDFSPNYTLAQWRTFSGLDAHSINANPQIIDSTFVTLDAHLTQATSPCVGGGVNTPWTPPQWVVDAGVLADGGAVVGTTNPTGAADSGTMDIGYHYPLAAGGALGTTNVEPATLFLNTTNTVNVTCTPSHDIPSNGKIVITFPVSLGGGFTFNSTGTTTASFTSGGTGSLSVSTSGAVITLTRSGGSTITAASSIAIAITNILNPPQVGSTGPYQIKTTDSAGVTIDSDTNVSSDQIIAPSSTYKTLKITGMTIKGVVLN